MVENGQRPMAEMPARYYYDASAVRDILDSNGFTDAENICNEWNVYGNLSQFQNTPLAAAFVACAMIYFEDAGMTMVNYFPTGQRLGTATRGR